MDSSVIYAYYFSAGQILFAVMLSHCQDELLSVLVCFSLFFSLGAVLIPGAALGQILGGAVVSRYKMTCKYAMKFALVTSGVALVLTFLLICAKCENEPFAGVSESYNG